ncbi:hypothetical protein C8R45DRAFT_1224648 [Mycena sanguinolenta]|nr:hypothetical protein C8R45DRAFT_1224648 [Mycena sanguinolenta]
MSYGRARYIKTERDNEQNVTFERWLRPASGIRDGMELNRCLIAPANCNAAAPQTVLQADADTRATPRPRFRSACDFASTVAGVQTRGFLAHPRFVFAAPVHARMDAGKLQLLPILFMHAWRFLSSSPYVSAARPYAAPSALDEVDYAARARAANFPDAAYLRVATQIRSRAAPARPPPCGRARIPTAASEGSLSPRRPRAHRFTPFGAASPTTIAACLALPLYEPRARSLSTIPACEGFVNLGLHRRAHAPDNSAFLEPLPLYLEHRLLDLRIPFSTLTFLTSLPNPLAVVFRRCRHSLCLVLWLHDLLDAGDLKKPKSKTYRSHARVKDVLAPPRSPQSHARLSPASSSSSNAAAHSDSPP